MLLSTIYALVGVCLIQLLGMIESLDRTMERWKSQVTPNAWKDETNEQT